MAEYAAVVTHSGGMDSSICLAVAVKEHGPESVLSLSFRYGQRHSPELAQARKIADQFGVRNYVVDLNCLQQITQNALMNPDLPIEQPEGAPPTTLVVGRNGLLVRLAAIHANTLGARLVYTGVIEVESANSGYRDCSRSYMDLMQEILRIDLDDDDFEIRTPVVKMTKLETMELASELGVLEYLLDETITCYEGIRHAGCRACPACRLRNEGLQQFASAHPEFALPYEC